MRTEHMERLMIAYEDLSRIACDALVEHRRQMKVIEHILKSAERAAPKPPGADA